RCGSAPKTEHGVRRYHSRRTNPESIYTKVRVIVRIFPPKGASLFHRTGRLANRTVIVEAKPAPVEIKRDDVAAKQVVYDFLALVPRREPIVRLAQPGKPEANQRAANVHVIVSGNPSAQVGPNA